jgi:1-acyl-sn-glycerol-3-phosphate acyltransferase
MNVLFSIYVWLMWIVHLVVFGPPTLLALLFSRRAGFRMVRGLSRSALAVAGIRVRVSGAEKVDWSRAHVFMGNHQNLLDPFILVLAVQRHMVGIEKQENHRIPIYGQLARAWGNIPIDRGNPAAAHATIGAATARMKEGASVLILPEGTRTKDGSIGPFKKGGFHMALDAGADIVPFTINGAYQVFQTGSWRVHPGVVEVIFGETIPTAGYTKETMDALVARVREAVCAHFTG